MNHVSLINHIYRTFKKACCESSNFAARLFARMYSLDEDIIYSALLLNNYPIAICVQATSVDVPQHFYNAKVRTFANAKGCIYLLAKLYWYKFSMIWIFGFLICLFIFDSEVV
jgi:hypothetical protein